MGPAFSLIVHFLLLLRAPCEVVERKTESERRNLKQELSKRGNLRLGVFYGLLVLLKER